MTDQQKKRDYPFYRGVPIALTNTQWLIALAGVAIAAWLLLGQLTIFSKGYWRAAPSYLLTLVPLIALAIAAGRHWRALFRKVRLRDVGWMFAFALFNWLSAIAMGFVAMSMMDLSRNPGIVSLQTASNFDRVIFLITSIPQLIGEELVTIIPFLAILYVLTQKLSVSRTAAVIVAWLVTAVWFAALHLPTYNYNIIQCLVLIGAARLVLTLAYIKTKNLWVSAGAHIINDWTTFALSILAGIYGTGS